MDQITTGAETIYPAVGKAVEESKHTLLWTLQNLRLTKVCILHVHQPANFITTSGLSFTATMLQQKEVGRKILDRIMNDYLLICEAVLGKGYTVSVANHALNLTNLGLHYVFLLVQAEKLHIETDDVAKGIVELILELNIKKLVMVAAADKHFSEYK
ncbi:hypothetical protein REPUB_Repub01dG0113100 [Reevesia pubescens]